MEASGASVIFQLDANGDSYQEELEDGTSLTNENGLCFTASSKADQCWDRYQDIILIFFIYN